MKRVAVTGLGVISPVGNDVPTFWNALCSGTCGIGPITKFDATDYPVKLAAEVRDFDPKQYMGRAGHPAQRRLYPFCDGGGLPGRGLTAASPEPLDAGARRRLRGQRHRRHRPRL